MSSVKRVVDSKTDRAKALKFLSQRNFYVKRDQKNSNTKQIAGDLQRAERDAFQVHQRNPAEYVRAICVYAADKDIEWMTLEMAAKCGANPQLRLHYQQKISQMQQLKGQTIVQLCSALCQQLGIMGLPLAIPINPAAMARPGMNMMHPHAHAHGHAHPHPFVVAAAHHAAAVNASQHHQQQQQSFLHPTKNPKMTSATMAHKTPMIVDSAPPPLTEEEKHRQEIENIEIPKTLCCANHCQLWLERQRKRMAETEDLLMRHYKARPKVLMAYKKKLSDRRTDMDVLKSLCLQSPNRTSLDAALASSMELKKVYHFVCTFIDRHLCALRQKQIVPTLLEHIFKFETCEPRTIIDAQQRMKRLLSENEFENEAQQFGNIVGAEFIESQIFESACNEVLNTDLELLRDFGVEFEVEILHKMKHKKQTKNVSMKKEKNDGDEFNLRFRFHGDFEAEMEGVADKPPMLMVRIDEARYQHVYDMLPHGDDDNGVCMDFEFMLNDDSDGAVFTGQHIERLENEKLNVIKNNGRFVSVVNVYNFYHQAITMLLSDLQVQTKQNEIEMKTE